MANWNGNVGPKLGQIGLKCEKSVNLKLKRPLSVHFGLAGQNVIELNLILYRSVTLEGGGKLISLESIYYTVATVAQ